MQPFNPYRCISAFQTTQHDGGDIRQRRAIRIGLADQPQALDSGHQEAGQRCDVRISPDFAARLRAGERIRKCPFYACQALPDVGCGGAILAGEFGRAIADKTTRTPRPGNTRTTFVAQAVPEMKWFEVSATRGSTEYGICSQPFLEHAFRTDSFRMVATVNPDGTWSYFEDTLLQVRGRPDPFHHTDRNTLVRVAQPTPNPLAREAAAN